MTASDVPVHSRYPPHRGKYWTERVFRDRAVTIPLTLRTRTPSRCAAGRSTWVASPVDK